jgi:hypothetical protein
MRRLVPLLIVCALGACKKDSKKEDGAAAQPASKDQRAIELSLDGKPVGTLDAAKLGAWAPLGSFLPSGTQNIDTWGTIEVTIGDHVERVEDPAAKHPGLVAAVFPGRGGPAFGFFAPQDLAKKGKAQWERQGVSRIAVTSRAAAGGQGGGDGAGGGAENEGERPAPSADLKITIVGPAGETVFTGDKLGSLPTTTAPVGDTETPGWTIDQILTTAGVSPKGKVVVYGEESANLILEPSDLDPTRSKPFIKLNRSGQLRFRLFRKNGETWDIAGELRGISRIELK